MKTIWTLTKIENDGHYDSGTLVCAWENFPSEQQLADACNELVDDYMQKHLTQKKYEKLHLNHEVYLDHFYSLELQEITLRIGVIDYG